MEENPQSEESHAVEDKSFGENPRQFKGITKRKSGSWVSKIWERKSQRTLPLGSYTTAEQAARAYDAAAYCLRGPNATFNFPDSIPSIPFASSLCRQQIQHAAKRYATTSLSNQQIQHSAKRYATTSLSNRQIQLATKRYATLNQVPSVSSSGKNNNEIDNANNSDKAREGSASASGSASLQDSVSLNNSQHQQEDELPSVQDSVSLNNSQHQQENELASVQDSVSLNNSQHQQENELASVQDSVSLNNSQHQQEDELASVQDSVSFNNRQHQQEDELASVQDSVSFNNRQHQQEDGLALCESRFTGSDNWLALPSIDLASALYLFPIRSPSPRFEEENLHEHEEEENTKDFQQSTDLWNFGDV